MSLGHGVQITRSNLKLLLDRDNIKSYTGSGTAWTDLIRKTTYSNPLSSGIGNEAWMGGATSGITISIVLKKIQTYVGYAEHPVNKWTGTSDASFVLYHFGTTGTPNRLMWYANKGGTWGSISGGFTGVNGNTYAITLQYNDASGGQMWVNGVKVGGRTGSGTRGTSSASCIVYGPDGTSSSRIESCYMWDRELSDTEIKQNFEATRGRYGI